MNKLSPMYAVLVAVSCLTLASAGAEVPIEAISVSNRFVRLDFCAKEGSFDVIDLRTGEKALTRAGIGGTDRRRGARWTLEKKSVDTAFGRGEAVIATVEGSSVVQTGGYDGRMVYEYALLPDEPFVIMTFGVRNGDWYRFRLRDAKPVREATWYPGATFVEPRTLDSGAGGAATHVSADLNRCCENGVIATALVNGRRRTLVAGGLSYDAFGKYVEFLDGSLTLFAHDPMGVLVGQNDSFRGKSDTFYLDCVTDDPFEAAERYGRALRKANGAKPKVYDFPLLCGWSVGALCKLPNVNTSAELVREMDFAVSNGLARYTRVGVRLEPDAYQKRPGGSDSEQGWYDDEHMRTFGHLVQPYDTLASWCKAVRERNGVPYTYCQVGMPSRTFIEQHPEWMLFNSSQGANLLYRSNSPIGANYDFTDPGLQKHFREVWRRFRAAGIEGVKFDYPCSGMFPGGGFENKSMSTTQAYREYFKLAREGLGDGAYLDERNLGYGVRPLSDQTAGLVDTQRIWWDSKDHIPEMVTRAGLRWFKSRTVFDYYTDTKALHTLDRGTRRGLLTSVYVTSGRLELSTSYRMLTAEMVHELSRFFPAYSEPFSARPVDAFVAGVKDPQIYSLKLSDDVYEVMLINTGASERTVTAALCGDSAAAGALGLDSAAKWHVHSFWRGEYRGLLGKGDVLSEKLGPMHVEMFRLTRDRGRPQVISSTRHVFQGWVEVKDERWDGETLSGKMTNVPAGDTERITIAAAGRSVISANVPYEETNGQVILTLKAAANAKNTGLDFAVRFNRWE